MDPRVEITLKCPDCGYTTTIRSRGWDWDVRDGLFLLYNRDGRLVLSLPADDVVALWSTDSSMMQFDLEEEDYPAAGEDERRAG